MRMRKDKLSRHDRKAEKERRKNRRSPMKRQWLV